MATGGHVLIKAVLENTGQRSLLDIVKLLAIESGELKVKLLPTPRVSDSKGVDNETEWARHSPGLAAMSFHLRSDDDQAGRDDEKLFSTPQARDWKGVPGDTYNSHKAVTHHFPVEEQPQAIPVLWGKYEPAVRRWEKLTRPAPIPTEPNKNGNPRLAAPFSEWMMGWPEGWVTDPEIGLPRTAQLKIIGNGVCPQQAYSAITELLSIHASEERMIQ